MAATLPLNPLPSVVAFGADVTTLAARTAGVVSDVLEAQTGNIDTDREIEILRGAKAELESAAAAIGEILPESGHVTN